MELAGSCTPDELDPTGAFRMVAERKAREAADNQAEGRALEAAAADAVRQLEAREKTEQKPEQSPLRKFGKKVFEQHGNTP